MKTGSNIFEKNAWGDLSRKAEVIGQFLKEQWRRACAPFRLTPTNRGVAVHKTPTEATATGVQPTSQTVASVTNTLSKEIQSFGPMIKANGISRKALCDALARHHIGQIRAYDMHQLFHSDEEIGVILGIPSATAKDWHESVEATVRQYSPLGHDSALMGRKFRGARCPTHLNK